MSFISYQTSRPLYSPLNPRPTTLLLESLSVSYFTVPLGHDCRHCSFNPHQEAHEARPLTLSQGLQCLQMVHSSFQLPFIFQFYVFFFFLLYILYGFLPSETFRSFLCLVAEKMWNLFLGY